MQRVIIMGPPGSGKSTLARMLGQRTGLPICHLDQMFWQAGWVQTPKTEFDAGIVRMVTLPRWIIEGNYTATLQSRLERADTLIYLDIPTWRTLPRVIWRALRMRGQVREDMPQGCPERFDLPFFWFAANWNRRNRARNLMLIVPFAGRKVIVQNGADLMHVIAGVAGDCIRPSQSPPFRA